MSDGDHLRIDGGEVWRNGTLLTEGTELDEAALQAALDEQQSRVAHALAAFAENTLIHLREEAGTLAAGIDVPQLRTRFRDRHALIVARGPGYKSDLRMVRPYIRDFRPVLVAVDGGADALREVGLAADMIVGDFDSVSDAALHAGAELVVHAYPRRRARPARRGSAGSGSSSRPSPHPGSARTSRSRSPTRRARTLLVAVGTHFNLVEFLERNREGMASTFVTRLKVGESLVDAKGVSRLVSRRVGIWPIAVFAATGIAAIVVAVLASPALRNVIESTTRAHRERSGRC